MTIRLRPHHLLCLLTYSGKGYTPAFTVNFDAITGRVADGEDIAIVQGPDDICAPLLSDAAPHCRKNSVTERDRLAAGDLAKLLGIQIEIGSTIDLTPALLKILRKAFASGRIRKACTGCEWVGLCNTIAASGFDSARV